MITRDDVLELLEDRAGPCVSLFVPTHRRGTDIKQDPIRFKNLLRAAGEELTANGMRSSAVAEMFRRADALRDDNLFWRHQSDALACFIAPD